jgi:hypothetical protein
MLYVLGIVAAAVIGAVVDAWAWEQWTLYRIWRGS